MQGQINSLNDEIDDELQNIHCEREEDYINLDAQLNIEACMMELTSEQQLDFCKFCDTHKISTPCLSQELTSTSVVELNLVHTPVQLQSDI